jgi:plastocyanin
MKRRTFVTSVLAAGVAAPVTRVTSTTIHRSRAPSRERHCQLRRVAGGSGGTVRQDDAAAAAPAAEPACGGAAHHKNQGWRDRQLHHLGPAPVQVYIPGTTVDQLLAAADMPGGTVSIGSGLPPVLNVAEGRVFRGIVNPAAADRVGVVHFPDPGTYLVVCGILPHLAAGMYGWVTVLR